MRQQKNLLKMPWIQALKSFNRGYNPLGSDETWVIPKKGSNYYQITNLIRNKELPEIPVDNVKKNVVAPLQQINRDGLDYGISNPDQGYVVGQFVDRDWWMRNHIFLDAHRSTSENEQTAVLNMFFDLKKKETKSHKHQKELYRLLRLHLLIYQYRSKNKELFLLTYFPRKQKKNNK